MAREALNRHSSTNVISSYQQTKKHGKKDLRKINCQSCNVEIQKFSWSKRHEKIIKQKFCHTCWWKNNPRQQGGPDQPKNKGKDKSDANVIAIQGITSTLLPDHMLFDPEPEWKRIESMKHPTLKLTVSVDKSDYHEINTESHIIKHNSSYHHKCPILSLGTFWLLSNFLDV